MIDGQNISVIIPVKNQFKNIGNCITAILNQSLKPREVIVVDGHSTDGTIDIINKYPVRLITEDYGTIGGARQQGVENAVGDYVAFTDADCVPEKDWLKNLAKEINVDVVAVGGGMKNMGDGLWKESISYVLDTFLGSANSVQDRVLKERKYVNDISGCNCIYKKSDVIKVGGFNKTLSICEDTDLNYKLLKFGKILYIPNANVLHYQDRDIYAFVRRMYNFGYGRGKNKYFDLPIVPPVIALIVISFLAISIQLFIVMILLYMSIIIIFTIMITLKSKKLKYLLSVPIIYVIEHLAYSIGFYVGLLQFKNHSHNY